MATSCPDVVPSRKVDSRAFAALRRPVRVTKLVCVECGITSDDGRGWRADIVTDDEGIDETEVEVWCPECWEEGFGPEQ